MKKFTQIVQEGSGDLKTELKGANKKELERLKSAFRHIEDGITAMMNESRSLVWKDHPELQRDFKIYNKIHSEFTKSELRRLMLSKQI